MTSTLLIGVAFADNHVSGNPIEANKILRGESIGGGGTAIESGGKFTFLGGEGEWTNTW